MTVIHLPEDLAQRLQAAAAAEGKDINNYAVAKLEQVLATDSAQNEEEADDDLIAALRAGIADRNAGRTVSVDEMDARIYALFEERKAANQEQKAA
jgi:predicted transcriptional regulator